MAIKNPIADAYYLAAKRWLDTNYRIEAVDGGTERRRRRAQPINGGSSGHSGTSAAGGSVSPAGNAAGGLVTATLSAVGHPVAGGNSGFLTDAGAMRVPLSGITLTDTFMGPQLQSWWMNRNVNASVSSSGLVLAGHSSGSFGTLQFGENYDGAGSIQTMTIAATVLGGIGFFFDGSFNSSGQLTAGYARRISGTNCELGTIVNDAITPGLTPASVLSNGDIMKVIWDGTTIDFQKNGVSQGTLARTLLNGPFCGIIVSAGSGTFGPYSIQRTNYV